MSKEQWEKIIKHQVGLNGQVGQKEMIKYKYDVAIEIVKNVSLGDLI